MGFFDIFKGKKKEEAPAEAEKSEAPAPAAQSSSPWPGKFAGFDDWEDDKKKAVSIEFLQDLGTRFENAKVKDMMDEDEMELRGRYQNTPVRIQYEMDMGWVNMEMKCNSVIDDLSLDWDLDKVPHLDEEDEDDDWDDDDEIRVFLAKGVYIEGYKDSVKETLAKFNSLPQELGVEIVETMQQLHLSGFVVSSDSISVQFDENSYEMVEPVNTVEATAALMFKTAGVVGSAEAVSQQSVSGGVAVIPVKLVVCEYCHTNFNLGSNSRCPNCGASHTEK